jgi:hypothetical protein
VKIVSLREPRPEDFVAGKSVLRATTRAVAFEADPPGWEMPPLVEGGRAKREARYFVVRFSTSVRTGETW